MGVDIPWDKIIPIVSVICAGIFSTTVAIIGYRAAIKKAKVDEKKTLIDEGELQIHVQQVHVEAQRAEVSSREADARLQEALSKFAETQGNIWHQIIDDLQNNVIAPLKVRVDYLEKSVRECEELRRIDLLEFGEQLRHRDARITHLERLVQGE